ncbi:unnamed protein product [Polarella glacialis]|uniref:RING-type domain-containing protein n=1 Tax=Polarella glacialis TaxID=89957 RepID=A0A813HYH2_POLGL|nr:unnamed protein product [Polarella glacialis]
MFTIFLDLGISAKRISYSVLSDGLGLSARPLALICACVPGKFPTLEVLISGQLLPGILGTVSVILIAISASSIGRILQQRTLIVMARAAAALYSADGLAQLPVLLWPAGHDMLTYPASQTGVFVISVQLLCCLSLAAGVSSGFPGLSPELDNRLWMLAGAVPLRYTSLNLLEPSGPSSWILYSISFVILVFVLTPRSFWNVMRQFLEKVCELVRVVCSFAYMVISYIWPKLQEFIFSILQHPFLEIFYRRIIAPFWAAVSPWCLPMAMLVVVYSCSIALLQVAIHQKFANSLESVLILTGKTCLLATAAISGLILCLHSAGRLCSRQQPDPLQWTVLANLLIVCSSSISFPWWLFRKVFMKVTTVMWRVMSPVMQQVCRCFGTLAKFAFNKPLLSIPCVLICNVILINNVAEATAVFMPLFQLLGSLKQSVLHLQGAAAAGRMTDSSLVVVFILAVQMGAYSAVAGFLQVVRAVRSERSGDALGIQELNELAATMDDARQCGRCGFGPVDHRGCSDLSSHHMEISVRGRNRSTVSNACPRCDWFTGRLQDWPAWDGEMQTVGGRAMFRQRVWCEVVVVVRAASKALLFPYCLLRLGDWLKMPASASAFLAFSYLLPWTFENAQLASSISNPRVYRRITPSGPRTEATQGADCGAAERGQMLPNITTSQALANIMTGTPEIVFLAQGDICSVCLERFPDEALKAMDASPAAEACRALQALSPPIVALRCGHPLHVECAEAAVSAGGPRHVRCPLCREPVTLAGEASAAMFS